MMAGLVMAPQILAMSEDVNTKLALDIVATEALKRGNLEAAAKLIESKILETRSMQPSAMIIGTIATNQLGVPLALIAATKNYPLLGKFLQDSGLINMDQLKQKFNEVATNYIKNVNDNNRDQLENELYPYIALGSKLKQNDIIDPNKSIREVTGTGHPIEVTLLDKAIGGDNIDLVKELLANNAKINNFYPNDLGIALNLIKLLISKNNLSVDDKVEINRRLIIITMLLEKKADPNMLYGNDTLLESFLRRRDGPDETQSEQMARVVKVLLDHGASTTDAYDKPIIDKIPNDPEWKPIRRMLKAASEKGQ